MPKLTAVAVANARPGRSRREIHDTACPSLYLVVQATGHKSWALRYRVRGRSHKVTLGPVLVAHDDCRAIGEPAIDSPLSLVAARELATKTLRQVKSGVDPTAAKRVKRAAEHEAAADTLEAIAAEYVRREGMKLRTLDQRQSDLDLLCMSGLGALPLDQVKRSQFVRVFDDIADKRGVIRSDRVLNAGKRLLSWHAGRSDYVSVLTAVKRRISIAERARDRVLSDDELQKVWTTAETFPAPFGPFVRFVLLTACRRNEAGGLRRTELVDPATWVLPRARWKVGAKAKGDLVIPLSSAAQSIVTSQPDGEFVFSSSGERPLTDMANHKTAFDAACGVTGWTTHDLRRTARTLLSRVATPDTAERCLGHALGGQRGTYDQHNYEAEMRSAFEALAAEIERIVRPPTATVADLAVERTKRKRKA